MEERTMRPLYLLRKVNTLNIIARILRACAITRILNTDFYTSGNVFILLYDNSIENMLKRITKLLINENHVQYLKSYWTACISHNDHSLIVRNENSKEVLQFPTVWLRDNCQCSLCFDQKLSSRLISFNNFTYLVLPKSVSCSKDTSEDLIVEVKWPDNHESIFPLTWLREHSFDKKIQENWLNKNCKYDKVTWNAANFKNIIRYFSFEDLLTSDLELLKWLLTLNRHGIAIVEGAGNDESKVEKLANRIGFPKKTTYGNFYTVKAKCDATNAAYLPTSLQLHTDLPYYQYAPSVNFLHFTKQSLKESEGINQLVDGLEVCKQFKDYDLVMYNILTNTLVEWTDIGKEDDKEFYHIYRAPVICENSLGDIDRINFSQPQRDTHFCVSIGQANEWYKAMNWFVHLVHQPKNLIQVKMKEGNILTFDNLRVLHGRTAFTGERTVIGVYMDWDTINSQMRILLSKLKINNIKEIY